MTSASALTFSADNGERVIIVQYASHAGAPLAGKKQYRQSASLVPGEKPGRRLIHMIFKKRPISPLLLQRKARGVVCSRKTSSRSIGSNSTSSIAYRTCLVCTFSSTATLFSFEPDMPSEHQCIVLPFWSLDHLSLGAAFSSPSFSGWRAAGDCPRTFTCLVLIAN